MFSISIFETYSGPWVEPKNVKNTLHKNVNKNMRTHKQLNDSFGTGKKAVDGYGACIKKKT